ncbi:MAG: L,D-transpeptidase family protein [bacterium]
MVLPDSRLRSVLLASLILLALPAGGSPVIERLRNRLESTSGPEQIIVGGDLLQCETTLRRFYQERGFAPAWTGSPILAAGLDSLLSVIGASGDEGLDPEDYHFSHLVRLKDASDPERRDGGNGVAVDLDLLATDAFLLCASHFLSGKVDPGDLDPEWVANRRQADLGVVLQQAVGESGVVGALRGLLPPQPGYGRLRAVLREYRSLAASGGWPLVTEGPKLEKGSRGERVVQLRRRLAVAAPDGPLPLADGDTPWFTEDLERAVRDFQQSLGLEVDGVVGPATLQALNVSAEERVRQIEVNLERWRWLPQDLGRHHVLVNIADFRLDVRRDGKVELTLPVIVGKQYRRTPVFSADMTYLVLSPAWEVPPKLAVQDKLPLIQQDPEYLQKFGFQVLQGWGAEEKVIDPATVDWKGLSARRFPYRLRQAPGPLNALGRVKFMFPNKFNVYIHDTPSRELFRKSERTFSSGCIRVQRPEELAFHLLEGRPEWSPETILAAMDSGKEKTVRLQKPVPVHLEYWTAWVDPLGAVHFRNDIYKRDDVLEAALRAAPPEPSVGKPGQSQ